MKLVLQKSKYTGKLQTLMERRGDTDDEHFRKLILDHLSTLEKEGDEKSGVSKAMQKALNFIETLAKGGKGLPVGTVREWKGKKFVKIAPGKWKPKYDSETRGAKMAISAIKRKIAAAPDAQTMLQIVLENRDRFSDQNGNPLPFVQKLSEYVDEQQAAKSPVVRDKDRAVLQSLVEKEYLNGEKTKNEALAEYKRIYPKMPEAKMNRLFSDFDKRKQREGGVKGNNAKGETMLERLKRVTDEVYEDDARKEKERTKKRKEKARQDQPKNKPQESKAAQPKGDEWGSWITNPMSRLDAKLYAGKVDEKQYRREAAELGIDDKAIETKIAEGC